jgi:hypothetical protein
MRSRTASVEVAERGYGSRVLRIEAQQRLAIAGAIIIVGDITT